MKLIDADELGKKAFNAYGIYESVKDSYFVVSIRDIINAPTIDAVPVNELLKLRDWLYESDGITMGGLRSLNELIAKYSSDQLPRIENGFERRTDD